MAAKTPKRVLVYRLGSLGDHLVALPSYRLVRRAFPHAEIRLLTNVPVSAKAPAAAAVLEGTVLVQGYLRYTVGTRSPLELARLWWGIFRWRPDVVVYLAARRGIAAARRDAKFFRLCGIRRMVGVPFTEAMQQNFYGEPTGERYEGNLEPEAARLARNIADLGDAHLDDAASWDLNLSAAEAAKADDAIREGCGGNWQPMNSVWDRNEKRDSMIAVSVGTKVQSKDWGRENWRALLGEMARRFPEYVLLLAGVAQESEAGEFAAQGWRENGGGPVVNLCGKLTPRQSAAAFAHAKLFVGHDSGPMHLAAAVGTPVVAIFAARNIPRQWFPFGKGHRVAYHRVDCWGCGLETCIEQKKKCLLSITVEEVMELVEQSLAAKS